MPKKSTKKTNPKPTDTYSYRGWLVSDYFVKRCLAILGYYFVSSTVLTALVLIFMMILGLTLGVDWS